MAIRYPAAAFTFTWFQDIGRYLIGLDDSPLTSVDGGRLGASTIVEQRVAVRLGERGETGTVPNSPVAQTVGSGQARVWRDGQRFEATWDRTTPTASTRFTTASGRPLPVSDGPLWILLVPA